MRRSSGYFREAAEAPESWVPQADSDYDSIAQRTRRAWSLHQKGMAEPIGWGRGFRNLWFPFRQGMAAEVAGEWNGGGNGSGRFPHAKLRRRCRRSSGPPLPCPLALGASSQAPDYFSLASFKIPGRAVAGKARGSSVEVFLAGPFGARCSLPVC